MAMGIDGLASGLNTTAIINALMAAEAIPQTLMKNKVVTSTALVTAMQALNTKFAALMKQTDALAKPGGLDRYQVLASSDSVTAKISAGAQATSLDLVVNKLAQAHTVVSAPMTAWPGTPAAMTFVKDNGDRVEVTAGDNSLDAMAYAINHSAAGMSAVKIASGVDANGAPQFRLQLTAKDSGESNSFTAYQGTMADVDAGSATDLMGVAGSAVLRQGQDAEVTLWAGSLAQQTIKSASNTFAALAPGVDITVNKVSATPVTVAVTRDSAAMLDTAKELTVAVNVILGSIFTQSSVTPGKGADGGSTVTAGIFMGNSTISGAKSKLFNAVAAPINGFSPATIGINTTKNGDLTFDEKAFSAAYAKDPMAVEQTLATIAGRVAKASKDISDPYDGSLSQTVKGQEKTLSDLNAQILNWDTRLATRRTTLQAIYTNLEVQMSKMQSQQSWLTAQIGAFDSGSSKK